MKSLAIKAIKRHVVYFMIICLFIAVIEIFDIGCPILYIFKIPCPTCGVTRAMKSLLYGDLQAYLYFSPMALLLCIAVLLLVHVKKLKYKKTAYGYAMAVCLLNFMLYIVKLFFI